MKCLILSARRFDFEDEQKRRVQGVTLNYVEGEPEQAPDRLGLFPLTISGTPDVWPSLKDLPGVYECDFKQVPGKNNRPTLKLAGVKFVAPVVLKPAA